MKRDRSSSQDFSHYSFRGDTRSFDDTRPRVWWFLCSEKDDNQRKSMIREIVSAVDWEKISRVMNTLDWRWGFDQEKVTPEMLKRSARSMLDDVSTSGGVLECGGLVAEASVSLDDKGRKDYFHNVYLKISFVLDSADACAWN